MSIDSPLESGRSQQGPRYAGAAGSTACDSIVVIRAAIAALADAPVHVVLTTGYQDVPAEIGTLPPNFHHATYLPGRAMAERESNARRLVALGAGELVMPINTADGEKQLDVPVFAATVQRVLADPACCASARRVAESMRAYGGAQEAASRIEQFAGRYQVRSSGTTKSL